MCIYCIYNIKNVCKWYMSGLATDNSILISVLLRVNKTFISIKWEISSLPSLYKLLC